MHSCSLTCTNLLHAFALPFTWNCTSVHRAAYIVMAVLLAKDMFMGLLVHELDKHSCLLGTRLPDWLTIYST